jgi:predicted metallopeptidase
VSFIYPRFIDLPFEEKVKTIVHELYHISESFNGDIRRFAGRTFAHSGRKANFDLKAMEIAQSWLKSTSFDSRILKLNSMQLKAEFGKIVGTVVKRPRIHKLP